MDEEILEILFESMWITKWKDNQTWKPDLTVREAHKVCEEVIKNLNRSGYEIKPINDEKEQI